MASTLIQHPLNSRNQKYLGELVKKSIESLASVALGLGIALNLITNPVKAADHLNLEEGLPIEVEDAYPIPYKGRELQTIIRYDHIDGDDILLIEPRIEYGFAPNWQGRIAIPFEFGSEIDDGIGDVGLEVFYNFNTEGLNTPAFALSLGVDLPTGEDSSGVDPTLKFIATKTIGYEKLDRVHLNVAYTFNTDTEAEERDGQFTGVLGYSRRLNSETILLADFVYEQEEHEDEDVFLLETGIRYQVDPRNVLAVGTGVGLNEDAPDFRLTFGWQSSF